MTFCQDREIGDQVLWTSRTLAMSQISRAQFERRLTIRLEEIERGLANRARQKTGYGWRPIVNHMYKEHADALTFANIADVMAECAQSILRLSKTLKDE
jgi:hypothetical protein